MAIAHYTQRHMTSLSHYCATRERFRITHEMPDEERKRRESQARSRILNAANRLGIRVTTRVGHDEAGPYIEGRIKIPS